MTPTLALLALLAFQCSGNNCPGGICLPPGYLPMPQPQDLGRAPWPPRAVTVPPGTMDGLRDGLPTPGTAYHWVWHEGYQQHDLMDQSNRQIGGYKDGVYRDYLGDGKWSEPRVPRIAAPKPFRPANDQKAGAGQPICGVVAERVAPADGKVLVTSNVPQFQALSLDQAKDLVQAGIPDFSKDRRIVFVGSQEQCNKVKQQLGTVEGAQVQCYQPGDWELSDLQTGKPLFEVRETPAAFVFDPPTDGEAKMVAQAHGQAEVNQLVEGLRQRRSDFDQSKVPGPEGSFAGVPINPQTVGIGVSVLLFVLGAVVPRKVHVVGDAL